MICLQEEILWEGIEKIGKECVSELGWEDGRRKGKYESRRNKRGRREMNRRESRKRRDENRRG